MRLGCHLTLWPKVLGYLPFHAHIVYIVENMCIPIRASQRGQFTKGIHLANCVECKLPYVKSICTWLGTGEQGFALYFWISEYLQDS